MKIQIFSQYYNLAQAGRVKPLACPLHKDEPDTIYPLIHQEENDKIVLQCLACSYKNIVGYQLYENLIEQIRKIENA